MRHGFATAMPLLLAALPLAAHHGSTGFDQTKPVHLVGRISQVEWMNPHVVVHLDVTGANGNVTTWLVNTVSPNSVRRMGFSQESFSQGTDLTIDGFQATDGSNHVNGTSLVFPDGKKITSPDCFGNQPYCYGSNPNRVP